MADLETESLHHILSHISSVNSAAFPGNQSVLWDNGESLFVGA